jgi:hypothetical protein
VEYAAARLKLVRTPAAGSVTYEALDRAPSFLYTAVGYLEFLSKQATRFSQGFSLLKFEKQRGGAAWRGQGTTISDIGNAEPLYLRSGEPHQVGTCDGFKPFPYKVADAWYFAIKIGLNY